jgi:hypothetical protein
MNRLQIVFFHILKASQSFSARGVEHTLHVLALHLDGKDGEIKQ